MLGLESQWIFGDESMSHCPGTVKGWSGSELRGAGAHKRSWSCAFVLGHVVGLDIARGDDTSYS